MKSFEGKVVWITGASSGIGRALAEAYSNAGAFTIISARREELLLAVKESLIQPDTCMVLPLDLSKHENASQWTQEALAFKGPLRCILVLAEVERKNHTRIRLP